MKKMWNNFWKQCFNGKPKNQSFMWFVITLVGFVLFAISIIFVGSMGWAAFWMACTAASLLLAIYYKKHDR